MSVMRYVWFSLSILCGLLIGLVAGSRLLPLPYENLHFSNLRSDYKTDAVLMVAEVYHSDQNIQQAQDWLKELDSQAPVVQVQLAMVNARDLDYAQQDMEWLIQLLQGLQKVTPQAGSGQ